VYIQIMLNSSLKIKKQMGSSVIEKLQTDYGNIKDMFAE